MNNEQTKKLCLSLMKADSGKEVIQVLNEAGYWDNEAAWRLYGDRESNYNTIGSQQSRPEAALVEKLVNAVDARLMNECLTRGENPEALTVPQTIREAVAQFFDDNPDSSTAGLVREWVDNKRTEVARGITLATTGAKPSEGNPCFTISDCGEGQTPEMMPNTLLSLDKTNKLRIPFVQGKFNMGGTGALRFCGKHNLQLVISRRNPNILDEKQSCASDSHWGFTIVRRENPSEGRRSSVYTYLAPVGMEKYPGTGGVLHFSAKELQIFPDGRNAYARRSEWGTLIKLYEYSVTGFSKTHILRKKGLLSRLDLFLPDVALPIRLHECRQGYRGHKGSFETTLTGIGVRLEDDKQKNLEDGFPSSCPMSVTGEQMIATIYAFKKGKAETYRGKEGIIFTVNGQTHGHFTTDFFRRVGLSYLRDSILVIVDCSKIKGRAREDLFMNSRDRLSGDELRIEIENAIEQTLKQHQGLRDLRERRRREEIEDKLEDSKPLEEVLESILKQSPTLSTLFLQGKRLSTPFKTRKVQEQEEAFEGKRYPNYFKFRGKDYSSELHRNCYINKRCRIVFETDVVNDYFSRNLDAGEFSLFIVANNHRLPVRNYTLNLQNGIATLNLQLPSNCRIGDNLKFIAEVTDRTQIDAFANVFVLTIDGIKEHKNGGKTRGRKPPGSKSGENREIAPGIELPKIIKVYENPDDSLKGWEDMSPPFDRHSALRVINAGGSDEYEEIGNGKDVYDFFINVDNLFVKTEQKTSKLDTKLVEARFTYGMVLLGMGLLHQESQQKKTVPDHDTDYSDTSWEHANIEDKVEEFTKAVAPILLPMIDYLGALELDKETS